MRGSRATQTTKLVSCCEERIEWCTFLRPVNVMLVAAIPCGDYLQKPIGKVRWQYEQWPRMYKLELTYTATQIKRGRRKPRNRPRCSWVALHQDMLWKSKRWIVMTKNVYFNDMLMFLPCYKWLQVSLSVLLYYASLQWLAFFQVYGVCVWLVRNL